MTLAVSTNAGALRPVVLVLGGVLAGAVVLFWWMRYHDTDVVEAFLVTVATVAFVGAGLWLAREGLHEAMDHRALRLMSSGKRRTPGAWVAVAGRAVALGHEIRATLSDRPALACSYKVFERHRSGSRRGSGLRSEYVRLLYEGYHLTPTGIETDNGIVPVRGLPDLVDLEKTGLGTGGSQLKHAEKRSSRFLARYAARAALAVQVRDRFDVDWRYGEPQPSDSMLRKEWVLPPGERVCVFGSWDGQALVPSQLRARGLPVYAGRPEEVARRLGGGRKVFFALALIPLAVAGWLVFAHVG